MGIKDIFRGTSGSILGGLGVGALDAVFSSKSAQRQRSFEKHMFRNRYQYAVEDLMKAGLNPMLAYGHGPGQAPAGASAQGQPGSQGTSSAAHYRLQRLEEKRVQAETQRTEAEADEIRARTPVHATQIEINKASVQKIIADTELSHSSAARQRADTRLAEEQIPKIWQEIQEIYSRTDLNVKTSMLNNMKREEIERLLPFIEKMMDVESYSHELDVQRRENLARMARTWWGRVVVPFIQPLGSGGATPLLTPSPRKGK